MFHIVSSHSCWRQKSLSRREATSPQHPFETRRWDATDAVWKPLPMHVRGVRDLQVRNETMTCLTFLCVGQLQMLMISFMEGYMLQQDSRLRTRAMASTSHQELASAPLTGLGTQPRQRGGSSLSSSISSRAFGGNSINHVLRTVETLAARGEPTWSYSDPTSSGAFCSRRNNLPEIGVVHQVWDASIQSIAAEFI